LTYIEDFKNAYHELLGKKYFPCIYVKNETESNLNQNNNYENDEIDKERIKNITNNLNFPLVTVLNNFNFTECQTILENIIREIDKEANDDFPYSLQYKRENKLNIWLKYFSKIYFSNLLLLICIIVI